MKKIISISFILVLNLVCALTAFSQTNRTIPAERQLERLVDNANLLDASQKASLLAMLNEISERQKCDVAIVTVHSLNGATATAFADDFFDYNGYGYGQNKDGILFLISMEGRDWAITTHSFGITAFTDAGQGYIMESIMPYLKSGNYSLAFNNFADLCDDFLTQARTGVPYDIGNMPKLKMKQPLINFLMGLVPGVILSFLIVGAMKRSLKSVRKQVRADTYAHNLELVKSEDTFLYSTVTRTAKPSESSGGSGGSSTHTSSSGSSHGGSSGKF